MLTDQVQKELVAACEKYGDASNEIYEIIVRIDSCWLRVRTQLDFIARYVVISLKSHSNSMSNFCTFSSKS
jgi:hypothetical protein